MHTGMDSISIWRGGDSIRARLGLDSNSWDSIVHFPFFSSSMFTCSKSRQADFGPMIRLWENVHVHPPPATWQTGMDPRTH